MFYHYVMTFFVFTQLLPHHLLALHDDEAFVTLTDALPTEVVYRLLSYVRLSFDRNH